MKKYRCLLAFLLAVVLTVTVVPVDTYAAYKDEIDQGQIQEEFIPASNEPSGCLQTFGDCREGQQPRCSATGLLTSDSSSDLNEEEKMETKELEAFQKDGTLERGESEETFEELQMNSIEGTLEDSEDTDSEISIQDSSILSGIDEYSETQMEEVQLLDNAEKGSYVLTYRVENGGAIITGYEGIASGDLIIPDTIDGYKVKSIGDRAFYHEDFTGSLELPSGLISIGDDAFSACNFTGNLELPLGLTNIGSGAFYGCDFTGSLELPPGITKIESCAFQWSGFTGNLKLPSGLISIGNAAFCECGFTGSLELPSELISIGDNAFYGCKGFTGSLKLPLGLTHIDSGAFRNCEFTGTLKLPPELTDIYAYAFGNCKGFTNIRFTGDTPPCIHGAAFDKVVANAYYPTSINVWDDFIESSYGGTLTWIPYMSDIYPLDPESTLTGTLEAVDGLGFLVTIDGIAYDVADNFDMNTAMELFMGNDKRVACILQYGKISEMVLVTDILEPIFRLTIFGGGFVYQNENFSDTQRQLCVTVKCGVKAPYKEADLEKFTELSLFCERFKLSITDNGLNFGQDGTILKKSITEVEQEIDAALVPGDARSYDFTLNLEDDFIPEQISTEIPVTGELTIDGSLRYGSCKVIIANIDLQAQKAAEKKEQKELSKKINSTKESLDDLNLALGSTLDYYFDKTQVKEIKAYLNVWLAEIISSSSISYTKQDKKIRDNTFKKLGINNNAIPYIRNTKAVTTVTGMTVYGERSFEFKVDMGSYIMGDGNPYTSLGTITYELIDKKGIPTSIPSGDVGLITFADMKTFTEKLQDVAESSVKAVYQEMWGKHANEVADIIVDKTIMSLINCKWGSFSNGIYTLFTEPSKSFVKKMYVECPVDVFVYDMEGNLCGSIVDNKVDSSNSDVCMYVEEDRKCVYLCGDDYKIKLVGNGDGVMTYRIEEYAEDTVCLRTVEFAQVPLTIGKTYTGFVMEPMYIDNSLYAITSDSDEAIKPDTDTYQDILVSRIYVDGIVMETTSLNLKEGETATLEAKVTPNNATNQKVIWNSDNENIVSVDEKGKISAKKAGMAKITARSEDGEFEVYCTVTVYTAGNDKPSEPDKLNGWVKKDGKWYYYINNAKQTGWQKVSSKWYYLNSNGQMQLGWCKASGKWYYLDGSGAMTIGWQKISGKWYYLDGSGAMVIGWQKISGKWYYLDESGVMQKGWQKIGGKWYYLDGSGVMQKGWQKISGKWYYLDGSGVMRIGWQKISGKWYYMNSNGEMQIGWKKVSGKWYYLDGSGAMQTGWQKLDRNWYYLQEDGSMVTSSRKINGKMYYFKSNGVWIR